MEEGTRIDVLLVPLFGSLLALAGALLLFAGMEVLVSKAIPARAAATREIGCPVHDVNRVDMVSDENSDWKEATRDGH